MSDVKRYSPCQGGMYRYIMAERPDGEYVSLVDYERLERKLVDANSIIDALTVRVHEFDGCVRAVATELQTSCGGVDTDQSEPHSATYDLLLAIREGRRAMSEAKP